MLKDDQFKRHSMSWQHHVTCIDVTYIHHRDAWIFSVKAPSGACAHRVIHIPGAFIYSLRDYKLLCTDSY